MVSRKGVVVNLPPYIVDLSNNLFKKEVGWVFRVGGGTTCWSTSFKILWFLGFEYLKKKIFSMYWCVFSVKKMSGNSPDTLVFLFVCLLLILRWLEIFKKIILSLGWKSRFPDIYTRQFYRCLSIKIWWP